MKKWISRLIFASKPRMFLPYCLLLILGVQFAKAGDVNNDQSHIHIGDYRTCKICSHALDKSMAYLKNNLKSRVLDHVWYAEMLGSFYAGFAFIMEGNSEKEARLCAEHICKYFDWAKNHGGYEGWFCSMSMMYLTEFSLRYGTTPEIAAKLEWGAKWAHKTREKEGGWFHGPRWGEGNYALDISSVGCGYFMALEEMKALHLDTGPALDDSRDYVSRVCDGHSVAYGLYGKGGFSLAAASYILLGLTSSGQGDDPRVTGIGGFLKQNFREIRKAHASGMLHHFAVAAALHRMGPDAYAPFAEYYLHERLIPNERPDGTIGTFPNDNNEDSMVAYSKMKDEGDYVSTAILACMILLERPGAFAPMPSKKKGTISNKDAFRMATEALAKGELGKAYKYFAEVQPMGDSEELVPQAREQMRKIEEPLQVRLKEAQQKDAKDIEQAKSMDTAHDYRRAIQLYDDVIKAYESIAKEYTGVPIAADAGMRAMALRKELQPLKAKAVYGGVLPTAAAAFTPATQTAEKTEPHYEKLRNAELLKVWANKLKDRVQVVLKSGDKVHCDFKALNIHLTLLSINEQGDLCVQMDSGGQMDLNWSKLQAADLRSLAMDMAMTQDTPIDHGLAAFYLLCAEAKEKAEEHLRKAGDTAAAIREAFSTP